MDFRTERTLRDGSSGWFARRRAERALERGAEGSEEERAEERREEEWTMRMAAEVSRAKRASWARALAAAWWLWAPPVKAERGSMITRRGVCARGAMFLGAMLPAAGSMLVGRPCAMFLYGRNMAPAK